jgi:hypothetical protein
MEPLMREISQPVLEAAEQKTVRPIWLCELALDTGPLRMTTAPSDIEWGGMVFSGVGTVGAISAAEETTELRPARLALTLQGLDAEMVGMAMGEPVQGRSITLWLALLDAAHRMIGEPMLWWRGRGSAVAVEMSAATATIQLDAENALADWERARDRRWTDADQQSRYADDKGLAFVVQAASQELVWGRA